MDLKQIQYFLSVAETLNFTEASERNSISQPALTKAILKLESELGGTLIFRDGKHTRLTELGRKLRNEFSVIKASEKKAREIAVAHVEGGNTTLNIGISSSLGPRPFADYLGKVSADEPALTLVLHQVAPDMTQEQVLAGTLDACFCTSPRKPNPKIKKTELFRERLMAAVAIDSELTNQESISLADIAKHQYLDRLSCEFRPGFIKMMADRGLNIRSHIKSEREDWIQQLVAENHGITSLAEFSRVVSGIALRPISNVDSYRDVALISAFGTSGSSALACLENAAKIYKWPTSE